MSSQRRCTFFTGNYVAGPDKQVAAKRSVRRSAWERPGADRRKKLPRNEPFAGSVLRPYVGLSRLHATRCWVAFFTGGAGPLQADRHFQRLSARPAYPVPPRLSRLKTCSAVATTSTGPTDTFLIGIKIGRA